MPMFLGNRSGVAPALQVNTPPTPLFLGNAASAALLVNTPPIALSRGSAVGQTPGLDRQWTARVNELQLPYGRFRWFEDPNVQWQLKLTDQQRQTLRDDMEWSRQQREQIRQVALTDPTATEQLYRSFQEEYRRRLNEILTPQQKVTWHQMTGEPLTLQPPFMSTTTGPR
jgi:Spy/CpxP family protein refolding chaperone